jgi:hypothetical protein
MGVSLRENTSEDLRDIVVEMLDRSEAKLCYSAEDEALQSRFDETATSARSFGNARVGRDFIRKFRRLLPAARPFEQESAVVQKRTSPADGTVERDNAGAPRQSRSIGLMG